jgi:myo-inositol-1(or 4)-monophosphatase
VIEDIVKAVKAVAQREILPRYPNVLDYAKSDGSLVTEADVIVQSALAEALGRILNVPVLGEEMSQHSQRELWDISGRGLWCLDPIDGTTNFAKGLPFFAVSVALMRDQRPILAVVHNPALDETYTAAQGEGAYFNDKRLPLRMPVVGARPVIAGVDFKRLDKKLAARLAANPPYSSQRNLGSSALDWCYLAAGRFDVYLHGGQNLWDYAAGSLILAEAGGQMCTLEKDEFWADRLWRRSVVAGLNRQLFAQWKQWLKNTHAA